jgi:hypothetical protein
MSVTTPTLKLLPLDELDELELLLGVLLLEVLLLLLLPHAASTSAAATTARTPRPNDLFLHPVTPSPFIRTDRATLVIRRHTGQ